MNVNLQRYRLRFLTRTADDEATLRGQYLGSTWRGAFGHALKRAVCVTGLPDCGACTLVSTCPYPDLFESRIPPGGRKLRLYPFAPTPYLLEPWAEGLDPPGSELNLALTLFGETHGRLPYALRALENAGQTGLTRDRVKLTLDGVDVEHGGTGDGGGAPRWSPVDRPGSVADRAPARAFETPPCPPAARIRLITPLRIRQAGAYVEPERFTFRALFSSLLRRLSLLDHFFGDGGQDPHVDSRDLVAQADTVACRFQELRWRDLPRYSNRQRSRMLMGGLVGSVAVENSDLAPFWPYLWFGQWTHVGKACSMGLGRYVVEAVGPAATAWATPARI